MRKEFEIKPGSAHDNGPLSTCLNLGHHRTRKRFVFGGIHSISGINEPKKVMRTLGQFARRRSRTENLQALVDLEGIGIDNLSPPRLRQGQRQRGFSRRGGTAQVEGREVHGQSVEKESPFGKLRTG